MIGTAVNVAIVARNEMRVTIGTVVNAVFAEK